MDYDNSMRVVVRGALAELHTLRGRQLIATTLDMQNHYRLRADELQKAINALKENYPEFLEGIQG